MSSATEINITSIPRITNTYLADLIKNQHPSLSIIDVRDDDHIGGHIVNSQNIPSATHDYTMPELVRTLKEKEVVVFHCALSQQRGPKAAVRYLRERAWRVGAGAEVEVEKVKEGKGEEDKLEKEEGTVEVPKIKGQKVYVLDGGFVKWQELYGEDKELTEGYQKDIWEFGY